MKGNTEMDWNLDETLTRQKSITKVKCSLRNTVRPTHATLTNRPMCRKSSTVDTGQHARTVVCKAIYSTLSNKKIDGIINTMHKNVMKSKQHKWNNQHVFKKVIESKTKRMQ